jgi:hypothetical protein
MRFENTGACNRDVQILAVGKVTQANMALQSRRTKSMTFTGCKENGALRFSHNSKRFFLQPPNDAVHKGAPHSEWKTYVHVKRSQAKPDGYDIQYWYFFPYNDSIASFNHEGDWEHITVTTDAAGAFVEAFYAQHEGGKVYKSDDLQMVLGQHPVVYIADGSHASYPRRDHFDIPKVPGLDDHTSDGGPVWQTWRSLIHVGEKNRPLNNQRFLSYGGRWGEIGTTDVTSGPEGPAFQSAWTTR